MTDLDAHAVVSQEEWIIARKLHLADEKAFTRLRDKLSAERRALPWVRVDKSYVFDGEHGTQSLTDAFDGRRQLIVQHFMYGGDWEQGCPSCSFWTDNLDGIVVHLNHRDASFVVIGHAPFPTLAAYRKRMGWMCTWLSSAGSDFNYDFGVSFDESDTSKNYNYEDNSTDMTETPGFSVFYKNDADEIFHTYSCYSRGLDMLNSAYHCMDLLPKGRDETANMSWLRHHDLYD